MGREIGRQFDELSKALASGASRRRALRQFIAGLAGVVTVRLLPGADRLADPEPALAFTPGPRQVVINLTDRSVGSLCVFDDNSWSFTSAPNNSLSCVYGGQLDQVARSGAGDCVHERISFSDANGIVRDCGLTLNQTLIMCVGSCLQLNGSVLCLPACGAPVGGVTLRGNVDCGGRAGQAVLTDSQRGKTYILQGTSSGPARVTCLQSFCTARCV